MRAASSDPLRRSLSAFLPMAENIPNPLRLGAAAAASSPVEHPFLLETLTPIRPGTPLVPLSPRYSPQPLSTYLAAAAWVPPGWLPVRMSLEGEDEKLTVSGLTQRNDAFTSAPESASCRSEIAGAFQSVEPISYQSTPVASLKNQHCLERTEHITLTQKAVSNEDAPSSIHSDVQSQGKVEKQTVGSAEKRRSAKQVSRTSASYVHRSRLTRSRTQSLSISTPESLKMKRTKSGRVVVPQLDPGSCRIVYDNYGNISGVAPVLCRRGNKSARPARKTRGRGPL